MSTPRPARLVAMLSILVLVCGSPRSVAAGSPPIANDDGGFQTPVNTPLQIPIATLLANDSDPDGGPVSFDVDTQPFASSGSVTPDYAGGILVYAPTAGFSGSDRIFYQAKDGEGLLDAAFVTVFVFVPNLPPVAAGDEYLMGANETLIVQASAGLFANDRDPEGNAIWLNAYDPSGVPGSLAVGTDGGFTYTPPPNLMGTVVFTYSITDGANASNVATVAIVVQRPSSPPIARNDAFGTPKDLPIFVGAPGVLGNDTDGDGQAITAVLVDAADFGAVSLQANGSFTYTPNAGFVGSDSFGYQAFDGTQVSGTATVTITVSATNLPPVPFNDAFQTGRNAPLEIPFQSLLANDTDVDGPGLFVLTGQFGSPTNGSLQVDAGGSRVTYTPNADFIGVDFFTYRISDGAASSAQSATVRITVTNLVSPDPTQGAVPTPTETAPAPPPTATATVKTTSGGTRSTSSQGGAGGTSPYVVTSLPSVGAGEDRTPATPPIAVSMSLALLMLGALAVRSRPSRLR